MTSRPAVAGGIFTLSPSDATVVILLFCLASWKAFACPPTRRGHNAVCEGFAEK